MKSQVVDQHHYDDEMESESLSSNDGTSRAIRINLKAGEAREEEEEVPAAQPSHMDVDRTDSLIESNLDTEK